MPGFDVADLVHAELPCAGSFALSLVRGEQECDVVPRVDALDDGACEPVAAGEDGTAVRTRTPFDVLELVDFVACLGAEEVCQVVITPAEKVDHERRRRQRDAVRPVRLRQPDHEARRIDAALRRKPDEAAVALGSGRSRHHVRGTVQVGDDCIEGFRVRAHFAHPSAIRPTNTLVPRATTV